MTTPYVSRSGRVIKKPELYQPVEIPVDDYSDEDDLIDEDEDEDFEEEDEDEDEDDDDEDADEKGNLKGFVGDDEEEDDDECD
jgi:hypothetical protein